MKDCDIEMFTLFTECVLHDSIGVLNIYIYKLHYTKILKME